MMTVASITDVEEYKQQWWQIGGKYQTSQTACKLTNTASQLAPFLAAVLLIMSNLSWEMKFSSVTVLHMVYKECIIIMTGQIWLKGPLAKTLEKGRKGRHQGFNDDVLTQVFTAYCERRLILSFAERKREYLVSSYL